MYLLKLLFFVISAFNFAHGVLYPIAVRLPLLGDPPKPGAAFWPKPSKVEQTENYYFLNKVLFKMFVTTTKTNNCEREIINQRIEYYMNILFPPKLAHENPTVLQQQMNALRIEIQNSKPNSENCKRDYYPVISNTNEESCKYNLNIQLV